MKTPTLVAALVLALAVGGGSGYAAGQLPKHSVGAKQLKKGAVTAVKLKAGAVTSTAVADGSLTAADLAPGTLPPRSGTVRLLGSDFQATSSGLVPTLVNYGGLSLGNAGFAEVHVPLPAGATVRAVRVRVEDDGPGTIVAFVRRGDPVSQAFVDGPDALTSAAPGGVTLSLGIPAPVPGADQVEIFVQLPATSDYRVYGAEVDYT